MPRATGRRARLWRCFPAASAAPLVPVACVLIAAAAWVPHGARGVTITRSHHQAALGAWPGGVQEGAKQGGGAAAAAVAYVEQVVEQQPQMQPVGLLNYNGTCTFSYKNSGAAAVDATALLYSTKLVLQAQAAAGGATGAAAPAREFELPLRSITQIFDSPPGSFVVRSTRGAMRCLFLETSRAAPPRTPPGPWTLCFPSLAARLRWAAELRFAWDLLGKVDARGLRVGRLAPQIARSFLLPPVGISTGRPFFAPTNNTICLASRAQCLQGNAPNGSVSLAPPAWSNAFPAPRAVPQQRWHIYPAAGGGDGDALQICQPNEETPEAQEFCLAAMRPPSDDFTGRAVVQPGTVRGDTARERQAKLDEWRVFTSCEGGDYRCFVVAAQHIGRNASSFNDARVCQRACVLDPACDGWTHTLAGIGNMRQGRCCLKQREDPSEPLACVNDECCTSGLKPRVLKAPADGEASGGGGAGGAGGSGGEQQPEIDRALDAVGVTVSLAPRNASSTRRWLVEGAGDEDGGGVRVLFVNIPAASDGDTPVPGDDEPLCLTLSTPTGSTRGEHVGLLPCVEAAEPGDVLAEELVARQTWAVPLPTE